MAPGVEMPVRDTDQMVLPAVLLTLAALPQDDRDAAAARLAKAIATHLDEASRAGDLPAVDKLAGRLLAVLAELNATPRARGAKQPAGEVQGSQALAVLRGGAA